MLPVYSVEQISKRSVQLIAEVEALFANRPQAHSFREVDKYYSNLLTKTHELIDAEARMKHEVLRKHMEILEKTGLQDKLWLQIKNSSTLVTNFCNNYAGDTFIIWQKLENLIKLVKEERMGMNTLVSAIKDTK